MDPFSQPVVSYLIAINIITFVLFGWDKWSARARGWRVSERALWLFALVGGSIGALVGMSFFRHKTQKASFYFVIALILLLHVGLAALLLWSAFG